MSNLASTNRYHVLARLRFFWLSLSITALFALTLPHQPPSAWEASARKADSLQRAKKYTEAAAYWEKAYHLARKAPDTTQQRLLFKQLYAKGTSYNYEKEGIPYFEKAYPLLPHSTLDTSDQSTFLNTYYHFLGYNNRWEEALPLAQECMRLRETLNEDPPLAYLSAVHDVAFINNKIGNYPEAIAYYHKSIDGYIKYNGERDNEVALGYNNLAFNYAQAGMANKSHTYYMKAAAIWGSIELADNSYLMAAYGNLMRWQKQYGDPVAMEGILANIREIVDNKSTEWGYKNRLIPNKNDHAHPTLLLSYWKSCIDYHSLKNDAAGVSNYLDSTRRFIDNLPDKPSDEVLEYLNNAYSVFGEVYADRGDHEEAIRVYRAGVKQMQKYGYGGRMEHNHARMAKSLMHISQLDEAGWHLQKAFESARRTDLAVFHTLAAQLTERRQQPDSVRHHVGRSLATLSQNDNLDTDFTGLTPASFQGRVTPNYIATLSANGHHLLRLYRSTWHNDDLSNARHLFTLALEMLNTYYLGGPYTEVLADMQAAIHFGLLECQALIPGGRTDEKALAELFENLENNRSKHRWKKFIKNAPSNSTDIPDSLREAEEEQRQLLLFYRQQLAERQQKTGAIEETRQLRANIHRLETALAATEEQMLAFNTRYLALSQGGIAAATLQKNLPKQVSMLRYMLTDSAAYVVRVDHASIALFPLGQTDSVMSLVQTAIALLQERSPAFYAAATALHGRLFPADLVDGLKSELVVIPDGILHQVPFEALTDNSNPSGFLLHTYPISYAGSVALWVAQHGLRHQRAQSFGVFAPAYAGSNGAQRTAAAPLTLAGAAKEAETIASMFDASIFAESTFGKQDFMREAPDYGMLHLAMHANVQDDSENSHFLFGDGSRLHAYELYGMKLPAAMAVLSACNTGHGTMQRGEGAHSLATAFTYAGVPSLVMGLWSLPDASTSGIMIGYYEQLKNKKHKHTALASAKIDYLNSVMHESELQHPYYWAGLVISGNTLPITERENHSPWILAALLGLGILAYLSYRKNSKRSA